MSAAETDASEVSFGASSVGESLVGSPVELAIDEE